MAIGGFSIAMEDYRMRVWSQSVKLIEISDRINGTYRPKLRLATANEACVRTDDIGYGEIIQ